MQQIKRFFAPPDFDNPFTTRRASVINAILLIVILGGTSVFIASFIQRDEGGIQVASVLVALGVGLWLVFKRGNLVVPGIGFPIAIIAGLTYQIWHWGVGTSDEVILAFPLAIALGSLMMGGRSPLWFTLAVNLVITITGLAEINGVLDHQYASRTDYFDLFLFNAFIAMNGALLYVLLSNYSKNLELAMENEKVMRETYNELQTVRQGLEVRVAERTRDLTLSADIGFGIAQERNLDLLLPSAVERIREAFALYYVQIYLTDSSGRSLILRAGSGTVGQDLLRGGHRLPLTSSSINGFAAFTKKSVLVEDTAKRESFLPNPHLPKTRSEMAIPLLSGERVLGVLNMQSEFPQTFTDETLPAYEILAGQLAAAIENAYQFAEIEKARAQIEAQSRLLTREGWDTYLDAIRLPEYVGVAYHNGEVKPLAAPAFTDGQSMTVPISIAGAEIGAIQLEMEDRTLTPEEKEITIRLATLAGQHMENLRLLTEAERYRREADRALRRLTHEAWESYQQITGETVDGYIYTNNRVKSLTLTGIDGKAQGILHHLTVRGEPIGALELAITEGSDSLDTETAELVAYVADALTAHIENLRLTQATETALAEVEHRAVELEALNRIVVSASSSLDLQEILPTMVREVVHLLKARSGGVAQLDLKRQCLQLVADYDIEADGPVALGTLIPIADNYPTIHAIETKRSVVIPNAKNNPQLAAIRDLMIARNTECLLVVPLLARGDVIGTLGVDAAEPGREFSQDEVKLAETVAGQLAGMLENARLFQETQKRAERESLINTINQRIQSATSVETALETTAREIGHLLKARRAVVELSSISQNRQ